MKLLTRSHYLSILAAIPILLVPPRLHSSEKLPPIHFAEGNSMTQSGKQTLDPRASRACSHVLKLRPRLDINGYKTTSRWRRLVETGVDPLRDLNEAPFQAAQTPRPVVWQWKERSLPPLAFYCGHFILRKDMVIGHYLNLIALMDRDSGRLMGVGVINSGYFME